ncbi:MAG: hypothetical protein ACI835_001542 [Planctomycetota bacterium]|jgi:hypothetical protein
MTTRHAVLAPYSRTTRDKFENAPLTSHPPEPKPRDLTIPPDMRLPCSVAETRGG